jgi:hypothetical protein
MQFLDACWLYGDKEKIARMYMMPVVMSTTYGERDGVKTLETAWEILGGMPCEGICGYIADTDIFEQNQGCMRLLEKRAENLYRTIAQKIPALPASNQVVKQKVSLTRSADLTPQESEQLSKYVSDDRYVKTQKADIQELSSLFRDKLKGNDKASGAEEYLQHFRDSFHPDPQIQGVYGITVTDRPDLRTLFLVVGPDLLTVQSGSSDTMELNVSMQMECSKLDEIISGRMTFQRAFMAGDMRMKGDFRLLRSLDQIFSFN